MRKPKKLIKKVKEALDAFSEKRGRGRPAKIPKAWVIGRAESHRLALGAVWHSLRDPLLAAQTEEAVIAAFEDHGQPYAQQFVPRQASEILTLIHDPYFPKRAKARIGFLADSLAGRPDITARRSRDICAEERARQREKSPHSIIRHEFYVECSCGYKGPARDNACRDCGAEILLSLAEMPSLESL